MIAANVQETYEIKWLGRYSVVQWKWTDIIYEYGNQNYSIVIHSYPELRDEKEIYIAVKKSNPQKVLRCIPYTLTSKDIIRIVIGFGFIICIIMVTVIKNKVEEKRSEKNIENFQDEEKISKEKLEKNKLKEKRIHIVLYERY